MKRFSIFLLVVFFSFLNVPFSTAYFSEAGLEKFRVAVEAPDFTLKGVGGTMVSLKAFRGKVVLLNFFATW